MKILSTRQQIVLLGLLVLAFAGGSCQKCAPAETGPPSLGFALSTDTVGTGLGFRKAEALSAYLVSYAGADLSQPLDTVRTGQLPGNFYYVDRTLFCTLPINTSSAGAHSYRLEVPASKRRYDITDPVLQYGAIDDCTRRIDRLDALVNGKRVDVRNGYTLTK